MALVPKAFIEQLLERVDIVSIIGERIQLKRSGSNWFGPCPFHQEQDPSFCVNPRTQFFHCFGCQEHGSAIGFIMKFDRLTFVEAVEKLANLTGLAMPLEPEDQQLKRNKERYFAVTKEFMQYFQRCMQHSQRAKSYLDSRQVNEAMLEQFAIGYAPSQWSFINKELGKRWSLADLYALGLSVSAKSFFPRFKERIIFPIRDSQGRVLGFGGRTIVNNPAKYLNSSESLIYHKGRSWYGLYEGRPYLDTLIVVEGYLDVVSLSQFGVTSAVASCGTAVSSDQLKLLLKRVKKIVFCFDGDTAGRRAAWHAMQQALPLVQDGSFSFVFLPEPEDPDSLIRKWHADKFRAFIDENAVNLDDFLIKTLMQPVNMNSVTGKNEFIKAVAENLALMPKGMFYQLMVTKVNQLVGLNVEEYLSPRKTLSVPKPERTSPVTPATLEVKASYKAHPLILRLLKLLAFYPKLTAAIYAKIYLLKTFLGSEDLILLLEWMQENNADTLTLGQIFEHVRGSAIADQLAKITAEPFNLSTEALTNELKAIWHALETERGQTKINSMIKQVGEQQLTKQDKLHLQELIKRSKLNNAS